MALSGWTYKLLSVVALLGLLLSPVQSLAVGAGIAPASTGALGQVANSSDELPSSGLYRTRVTVRGPADGARLERLGIVVLESTADGRRRTGADSSTAVSGPWSAIVLADDDQIEALARLRFEPQSTDELGALVAAHAQTKPWLAAGLQPLLTKAAALQAEVQRPALSGAEGSQGAEGQRSGGAEETASPEVAAARAGLRAAMRPLTTEQQAGLAALISVDDDADGLTNTQEQWWCTDQATAPASRVDWNV